MLACWVTLLESSPDADFAIGVVVIANVMQNVKW